MDDDGHGVELPCPRKMPIAELIGPTESTSRVGELSKVVMIGEGLGRESGWVDLGGFRARPDAIVGVYLLPGNDLSSRSGTCFQKMEVRISSSVSGSACGGGCLRRLSRRIPWFPLLEDG
jgi:hypothetical protein